MATNGALYLAWLLGVQHGEVDQRTLEPAAPDHLETLSPSRESFVAIAGRDRDLLTAAANGAARTSVVARAEELDRWVAGLDEQEKAKLLSRVARGEMGVGNESMRRFRRQTSRRWRNFAWQRGCSRQPVVVRRWFSTRSVA